MADAPESVLLTPATRDPAVAREWFDVRRRRLDG
jgi:hypothetical protein